MPVANNFRICTSIIGLLSLDIVELVCLMFKGKNMFGKREK